MFTDQSTGDAAAIISQMEALDPARLLTLPNGKVVVDEPAGREVKSVKALLDEYLERPERLKTTAELTTAESFIDYMNRFKKPESAVFAGGTVKSPEMLGMVDYHGVGPNADPSFCEHIAKYTFPLSDPMTAWINATREGLKDQATFAVFLQDRQYDIENPPLDWMMLPKDSLDLVLDLLNLHDDKGEIDDAALDAERVEADDPDEDRYIPRSAVHKLRKIRFGNVQRLNALSRGIEIAVGQKVVSAFSPKTGERVVHFSEEHDTRDSAGRKITVPEMFFVNIPVFDRGERHLLPVRLFYRQKGGTPFWGVELIDAPRLIKLAVDAVAAKVGEETGLPVFSGKPS